MTTELVELADCPFCGMTPELGPLFVPPNNGRDFTTIECVNPNCAVQPGVERVGNDNRAPYIPGHREAALAAWNTRALASRAGGPDDDGPVFSGRKIRFDYMAEKLLPVALGGLNCAGPHDWRMKEAIRAVLCELYPPAAPEPVAVGSNNLSNDEEEAP